MYIYACMRTCICMGIRMHDTRRLTLTRRLATGGQHCASWHGPALRAHADACPHAHTCPPCPLLHRVSTPPPPCSIANGRRDCAATDPRIEELAHFARARHTLRDRHCHAKRASCMTAAYATTRPLTPPAAAAASTTASTYTVVVTPLPLPPTTTTTAAAATTPTKLKGF